MNTCLVTGGAGFIGSHLSRHLVQQGADVRILDNFSTGRRENIADLKGQIDLIAADLRDQEAVTAAVRGVDLIFHQAAFVLVPLSIEDPGACFESNVIGTHQLLEAARSAGVSRVVLASSAAVYGNNPEIPLNENSSLESLSPYAASKTAAETYTSLFTHVLGLDVVALRYFNVYGPNQSPESQYAAAIPIFIKKLREGEAPVIYGDGKQSRDFIFIGDVVRANLLASTSKQAPGKAINICSGMEITINQVVDTLRDILNPEIKPEYRETRKGDIYRSLGNPGLAKEILGFQSRIQLKEGLMSAAGIKSSN